MNFLTKILCLTFIMSVVVTYNTYSQQSALKISTEIKYFVPNDVSTSNICVYDLTGLQLLKIEIKEKGNSSIILNANQLKAGMYLYTLITDGQEVDTKKMIITD